MKNSYNIIFKKLVKYAFKKNSKDLIKGILLFLSIFLLLGGVSVVLENLFYLSPKQKYYLVGLDVLILLIVFIARVLLPVIKMLGNRFWLNEEKLVRDISSKTDLFEDELINLYELNKEDDKSDLVRAGIDQKVNNLRIFDFTKFISFRGVVRFFVVYSLGLALIFLIVRSDIERLENPLNRIVNLSEYYEKPSPYTIEILNKDLNVGNGDEFILLTKITGEKEVVTPMITYGGNFFYLSNDSSSYYSYKFSDVNNAINFKIAVDKYHSKNYVINVLTYPFIRDFDILVSKPKYTNLANESFKNINQLEVPLGSNIEISFKLANTDSIRLNDNVDFITSLSNIVKYKDKVSDNRKYNVTIKNEYFVLNDYLSLAFTTLLDEFPIIQVNERVDSLRLTRFYFKGSISDDYGFSKLVFHYRYNEVDSSVNVPVVKNIVDQDFYFAFDFGELRYLNDNFEYFFEIKDNDEINGFKSAFSEVNFFKFPSRDEILAHNDSTFNNLNNLGQKSIEKTFNLQDKLNELQRKMINENLSDWEKQEFLKEIVNEKNELDKILKDLKDLNKEIEKFDENYLENQKDLIEKQKLIEELVEDVMSEELKKLMEDLAEMMTKFNDEKFNQLKEKMDVSLDDLSEQLDKNIDMLRRMQMEKKMSILNEELKEIVENEIKADSLFSNNKSKKSLLNNELEQKLKFNNWKANFNSLEELNEQLQNKVELFDIENETESINQNYDDIIKNIDRDRNKNINEKLDKNINDLQQLSFLMDQIMDMNFKEEQGEDIEQIKQILENLLVYSFDQEDIMYSTTNKEVASKILVLQNDLSNNFKVIKDSIYALARRQPQIGSAVNKEIVSIENSLVNCMNELKENRYSNGAIHMQKNITSTNNLALIFSDVLKQMNQNLASKKGGNCNKPGKSGQKPGGKPSMSNMKNAQKSFQKQLEMMMQKMKGGEGNPTSGDFGKALYQQEMLSEMMRELMNDGAVGSNARETLKKADEILEQIRTDVLNRNITSNTIERQKSIMTRLLEAENAEMEREKDKKRESEVPLEQLISKSAKYFDKNITNDKFEEKFERNNLKLSKFYYRKFSNFKDNLDVIRE